MNRRCGFDSGDFEWSRLACSRQEIYTQATAPHQVLCMTASPETARHPARLWKFGQIGNAFAVVDVLRGGDVHVLGEADIGH